MRKTEDGTSRGYDRIYASATKFIPAVDGRILEQSNSLGEEKDMGHFSWNDESQGHIRFRPRYYSILGFYMGYIWIMEKKMETTVS